MTPPTCRAPCSNTWAGWVRLDSAASRCTGRRWTWRCSAASTVICTCPGATATIQAREPPTDTRIDQYGSGRIDCMTQDNQEAVHGHAGFAGLHSHEGGAPHWHDEFGEHMFEDLSDAEFA